MGFMDYTAFNGYGLGGGGGGGGGSNYGKAGKKQLNLNVFYPLLIQAMYANAALGKDPIEFLNQFKTDKKGFKNAKKSGADTGFLKIGNSYYNAGALSQALPDLLQQQQDKALSDKQATYDKLAQTPQFSQVFADAKDPNATFDKYFGGSFADLAGKAGGAAALSGFYSDPLKQAAAVGPVALQAAQYKKQIQEGAQSQAWGLAGIGPLGSPSDYLAAGPAGSYMPGVFNAANLSQQQNQFNAQLGFSKYAQNQNFWSGLAGAGVGGAAYAYGA